MNMIMHINHLRKKCERQRRTMNKMSIELGELKGKVRRLESKINKMIEDDDPDWPNLEMVDLSKLGQGALE